VEHRDGTEALGAVRIGPTHGDLGPWNLRHDPATDEIALLDWEDYRDEGIQAVDVLNAVFTSLLVLRPEWRERGFGWLFAEAFERDPDLREFIAAGLRRYADETDQEVRALVRLLPVFCVSMIRRIEAQGRSADGMYYGPLLRGLTSREITFEWLG